ncbi:MAG: hypothetical protein RLZZ244_187 [Verrucomicrobiota bacterium]|jgi:hypothetical protein
MISAPSSPPYFGALVLLAVLNLSVQAQVPLSTPRIESFPREGKEYRLLDWRQRSEDFLRFALDPTRPGDYLPAFWWDETRALGKSRTFGLPTYLGMHHQWRHKGNAHEALSTMGVLITGALLGQDMTRFPLPGSPAPVNLVQMQEAYFSPEDGVFLNGIGGRSGGSFWYDISPNVFAAALVASYPQESSLAQRWHTACQNWAAVATALWHLNDFHFQAYDLRQKRAVTQTHREPDAAAGLAYLLQMAHAQWPEETQFLHASRNALTWLCTQDRNPNYEILLPFGVLAAARSNAEHGTSYDAGKVFGWCFEDSAVRGIGPHQRDLSKGDGWGVVSGRWGDHDVAGLVGVSRGALSTPQHRGGYGFAMNTFVYAWPLVSATRYDNRLARAVGKWMHAAVHSARLFYPDQLSPEKQTDWAWASRYTTAIPYEGVMEKDNRSGEPGPFGSGDPSNLGWGPLNLGIYSGALSGVFGAIVSATDQEGILALDTRKTDFFAKASHPTTLLYNPHPDSRAVSLPLGNLPVRVWEAVSNTWISEAPVTGRIAVPVPADGAALVTLIPSEAPLRCASGKLWAGSVVVDFSCPNRR